MQVQIYDFRWRKNEEKNFFCEFEANAHGKFGRKKITIGAQISFELKSNARCAGIIDETGIWKSCAKRSIGKPKCEYCQSIEGNFVFTSFDGFDQAHLKPGDLEKIKGEHWVYLALFSQNIIKIGVSKNPRKFLRQVEQGSFSTLYIAKTPDGITARQIETLIRRKGVLDKVKISQKKEFLSSEIPNSEKICRNIFDEKKSALDEYPHLKNFLLETPKYINWQNIYGLQNFSENIHDIKLKNNEWASGEIVGIKGSFIILKTPNEYISISGKDLRGREVEFSPKPAGLGLNRALQGSLF